MAQKNGNTVAVERRMDLASLFCMIGRHGPAVALTVIAMVSVLAGFIIYRTVRSKRRKAAAPDGDDETLEAERDASASDQSPEERNGVWESTDVSDGDSTDVKEEVDVIQSDLEIRHRRVAAAAEKQPPPHSPPRSESEHTASDDAEEDRVVWRSHKVTELQAEEMDPSPMSDAYAVADRMEEDAFDSHRGATDDGDEDVEEDVHGVFRGSEPMNEEIFHKEEEKVLKTEYQEVDSMTRDEDKSDLKEEENLQCSFNSLVYLEQNPHISRNDEDEDDITILETKTESNSEVSYKEDALGPCFCSGKDGESEEQNPDGIDYSSNNLSEEEEKKNGQHQDEVLLFEPETNQPSPQQEKRGHVMPPIQDDDWEEDEGLADEVIEEVVDEDSLNRIPTIKVDSQPEEEIEQKGEDELMYDQEDDVLCDGADQVKEEMLTVEEPVVLLCLTLPVEVEGHKNGVAGVATDTKAKTPGTAEFPDLSLGCQTEIDDILVPSLDGETDSTTPVAVSSHETEHLPKYSRNGETMGLNEELDDQVIDPDDQLSHDHDAAMINNNVFDMASLATDRSTVENASVRAEEIVCSEDKQQSDHEENDETRVHSATDATGCNNCSLITLVISEETPHPDMLSSSQDQRSDHVENASEEISQAVCEMVLPSFEPSEQTDIDISSPGFGKESGISSLAVSPDLQDAGRDFESTVGNMVLPVMDRSEEQKQAEISFFADDVAAVDEDIESLLSEPSHSLPSQAPFTELTDWPKNKSIAANEDAFGHEIEDDYHRAMDHYVAEMATTITTYTSEFKMQTDMKPVIEVVEIKEKMTRVYIEKKEHAEGEEDKEEDYEKTEISIMEATMDYNEWITESTYQVLPWLTPSDSSFAQDHTKTNRPQAEESQPSSAKKDISSQDATDVPPSNEIQHVDTWSLVDDNTESNKKVVAVQPMPQNVNVAFRVQYFTQSPYQTVAVTGDQQELGNWKGFIPLEKTKDGHWATVVSLPAESHVEWKFVVLDKGEVCRWEECGNRLLDTGCGDDVFVHKWWGLL